MVYEGWPGDLVATFLPTLTQGRAPLDRACITLAALTKGDRWGSEFTTTSCEVGRDAARRLLLSQEVQSSLLHVFDMWRGKSGAHSLNGADLPIAARIARPTGIAVVGPGPPAHPVDLVTTAGAVEMGDEARHLS